MGYYDSLAFRDENPVIERVLVSSPPDGSSWFLGGKCNSFIVSPEESCENSNEGGPIVFTCLIFGLRNVYLTFNLRAEMCLFETLKMFYPPKGLFEAEPEWGPFDVLSILLCLHVFQR